MTPVTKAPPRERPILFSGPMVHAILAGGKTQTRRIIKPARGQEYWLSPETVGRVARWAQSPGTEWFTMAVGEDRRIEHCGHDIDGGHIGSVKCPYGMAGDRLWVRETHAFVTCGEGHPEKFRGADHGITSDYGELFYTAFAADIDVIDWEPPRFRPSIHMPRWASRILLEVLSVRVERLTEIEEADAVAEGVGRRHVEIGTSIYADRYIAPGVPLVSIYADQSVDEPIWHTAREAYCEVWNHINGPDAWGANPWVWVVEFRRITP